MNSTAEELIQVTRILCVDDERSVLMSLKRLLRGEQFDVCIVESGKEGLALIESEEAFDLIISDMRMPEMDGAEFLATAAKIAPDSVRILLTGYSDQEATIRAINEGKVYRYLHKPWDNDELKQIIDDAIQLKQTSDSEKDLNKRLKNTLVKIKQESAGLKAQVDKTNQIQNAQDSILDGAEDQVKVSYRATIKAFSNLINFRTGRSHKTAEDIAHHAVVVSEALGLDRSYLVDIEHAAVLYPLGMVTLSDSLLTSPVASMSPEDRTAYQSHPVVGEQILAPIDALSNAAVIVRHQNENFDGSGSPDGLEAGDIPVASRILRLARDFNEQLDSGDLSVADMIDQMSAQKGKIYDPELADIYIDLIQQNRFEIETISGQIVETDELSEGMTVSRDMYNSEGILILSKGAVISTSTIDKLVRFEQRSGEKFKIGVNQAH